MIPSTREKYCIECKYAKKALTVIDDVVKSDVPGYYWDKKTYLCINPVHGRNLVTGEQIKPNCLFARTLAGKCGPNANHFEPKESNEAN